MQTTTMKWAIFRGVIAPSFTTVAVDGRSAFFYPSMHYRSVFSWIPGSVCVLSLPHISIHEKEAISSFAIWMHHYKWLSCSIHGRELYHMVICIGSLIYLTCMKLSCYLTEDFRMQVAGEHTFRMQVTPLQRASTWNATPWSKLGMKTLGFKKKRGGGLSLHVFKWFHAII